MDEKITVRFPSNHSVFDYPAGQRSSKIRELVDLSMRLESLLRSIDSRLSRIESMVTETSAGIKTGKETKHQPINNVGEKKVVIDIDAFTDI